MLKQLEEHALVKKLTRMRGKGLEVYIPHVLGNKSLSDIVDLASQDDSSLVFPEAWNIRSLREFASKHLAREHNVVTLSAFLDARIASLKRKGSGKQAAEIKAKIDTCVEQRRKLEANEALIGKFLTGDGRDVQPAACRYTSKQQEVRAAKAKYKRSLGDLIRGRRYSCQPSAQQCFRKLLKFLCPHTIDLATWKRL